MKLSARKTVLISVLVTVPLILSAAGWYIGLEMGKDIGYDKGKKSVSQKTITDFPEYKKLGETYFNLQMDYNKLVDDYNALLAFANTPQYQPRQTIDCTTNTYFADLGTITTRCR